MPTAAWPTIKLWMNPCIDWARYLGKSSLQHDVWLQLECIAAGQQHTNVKPWKLPLVVNEAKEKQQASHTC
jgi:hypothetical protein